MSGCSRHSAKAVLHSVTTLSSVTLGIAYSATSELVNPSCRVSSVLHPAKLLLSATVHPRQRLFYRGQSNGHLGLSSARLGPRHCFAECLGKALGNPFELCRVPRLGKSPRVLLSATSLHSANPRVLPSATSLHSTNPKSLPSAMIIALGTSATPSSNLTANKLVVECVHNGTRQTSYCTQQTCLLPSFLFVSCALDGTLGNELICRVPDGLCSAKCGALSIYLFSGSEHPSQALSPPINTLPKLSRVKLQEFTHFPRKASSSKDGFSNLGKDFTEISPKYPKHRLYR